jgi:Protein of unknown function (DUF2950)
MKYLRKVLRVLWPAALLMVAADSFAQDAPTKSFATYHAAAAAFVAAVEANDVAAQKEILGADAPHLLSSGDASSDEESRLTFLKHYHEAHALIRDAPDRVSLTVGRTAWVLPFPIVRTDGVWRFDAAAGAKELNYRRIGQNELDAIRVCRALFTAQKEYAAFPHDGNPPGVYAMRFRSKPGTQNGLYWEKPEGEADSPAGSLIAEAAAERDDSTENPSFRRNPFHGYYFRILRAQGAHAPGGTKEYAADGKMTGGFAILAFPAEYGASGVMTFLISVHNTLYQKDLGTDSSEIANGTTVFDPDATWKVVH